MTYNKLIKTVSAIAENEDIEKKGLSLTYTLLSKQHMELQEYFYLMENPKAFETPYTDTFEVDIAGLVVRFVKKV